MNHWNMLRKLRNSAYNNDAQMGFYSLSEIQKSFYCIICSTSSILTLHIDSMTFPILHHIEKHRIKDKTSENGIKR